MLTLREVHFFPGKEFPELQSKADALSCQPFYDKLASFKEKILYYFGKIGYDGSLESLEKFGDRRIPADLEVLYWELHNQAKTLSIAIHNRPWSS